MINRIVTSTALAGALALSAGAYAQTTNTPTNPSQHIQSGANVLLHEQPNDFLARQDLIGTDVHNEQNQKIGEVEDIVLDKSGQIKGVVVGVGGFLGVGEKHVALAWNDLQIRPPAERSGSATSNTTSARHPMLVANVTKDQLQQAQDFKRVSDMNGRTPSGTYGSTNTKTR